MKRNLIIFVLLLLSVVNYGQKVKIRSEKIKVAYTALPSEPLDAAYKYYSHSLSTIPGLLKKFNSNEKEILSYFVIPGFKLIEKGGDFHLEAIVYDREITGTEIKKTTTKKKDKSGKETTSTHYNITFDIAIPISMNIIAKDNSIIEEIVISTNENKINYKSKNFGTWKAADAYWKKARGRILLGQAHSYIKKKLETNKNNLAKRFGFRPIKKGKDELKYNKYKKHPSFQEFLDANTRVKDALAKMTPFDPVGEIAKEVQPSLDFWVAQADQLSPKDKKEKKLRFVALFNLMRTNYWMENYDAAKKYAEDIIAMDFKPKNGKNMLKLIENTRSLFEINNMESLHLDRTFGDPSEEVVNTKFETSKEEFVERGIESRLGLTNGRERYEGYIIFNVDKTKKVDYTFVYKRDQNKETSMETGNVRAYRIVDGNVHQIDLKAKEIKELSFDGKKFVGRKFKTAASIDLGGNRAMFLQVLYESPKINVYSYNQQDGTPEFILEKTSDNKLVSMSGLKFLVLKKGLAKFYADCQDVEIRAGAGEFRRSASGLIASAKAYNECK